jgi:hypothetical protein
VVKIQTEKALEMEKKLVEYLNKEWKKLDGHQNKSTLKIASVLRLLRFGLTFEQLEQALKIESGRLRSMIENSPLVEVKYQYRFRDPKLEPKLRDQIQVTGEELLQSVISKVYPQQGEGEIEVRIFYSGLPLPMAPVAYGSLHIPEFMTNALNDVRVRDWIRRIRCGGISWGRHLHWLVEKCREQPDMKAKMGPDQALVFPLWCNSLPSAFHLPEIAAWDPHPREIDSTRMARILTEVLGGSISRVPSLSQLPCAIPDGSPSQLDWFQKNFVQPNLDYQAIFGRGESKPGSRPTTPLIQAADTLLLSIGDRDAVETYLQGLGVHEESMTAPKSSVPSAEQKRKTPFQEMLDRCVIGDLGGALLQSEGADQDSMFRSLRDRWLGLRLSDIIHCATSAAEDQEKNGVMVWAIGKTRAPAVISALRKGTLRPTSDPSHLRPAPTRLINKLIIDGQLAAALLRHFADAIRASNSNQDDHFCGHLDCFADALSGATD